MMGIARFDWKDGVLVCAGMIAAVSALVGLRRLGLVIEPDDGIVHAAVLLGMGGPVAARRAVFGAPALPPPRTGPVASLVSIIGLLATLAGLLLGLLGFEGLAGLREAPPDFEGQILADYRKTAAQIDGLLTGVVGGSADERERQLVADAKQAATEALAQWEARRTEQRDRGTGLVGAALILVGLGALASWWRYPRTDGAWSASRD